MFAELPAYAQYYQAERPGLWLHKIDGRDKLERKWRLRRQQLGYHEGAEAEAEADVAPETTGDDEADVRRRQTQARAQPVYNYYRTHTQPTYQFVLPAVPAQSPPYHYYYSPAAAASRNRANATPKYNKGLKSKLSNDSDYCWEFLQKGWCPRGDQCTWKHGTDTICRFFPDCTNANCRFVHPDAASTGSAAVAVGTAEDVGLMEADKPDAEHVDVDVELDLDEETRAYQARLVSLKATIEREEQKVKAKLERAGTLQDTFKRIDADKKMLTEKLERTEREIVLERERYETCKARLQEIAQKEAQEVTPLQSQLDDQAQAKSGLREQVEELKQQLSRKQEELATMDRECGALQEDITAVRSRYQSQTDEVVDERNRYEQRTEQLFAQRKKCEHTLNALSTDMVNVQNEEREFEEELEHEATETDRESIAQSTKRAPIESDWCWDFVQKGWCQRGASCQWKHGEQPAVATETQTPVAAVAAVTADTETVATATPTATGAETEAAVDKKDPVCWEFSLFGTCPRGANCHWQHVSASASSLPSKESEIKKLCVEDEEEEEETVEVEETSQVTEGVKAETPTKQEESPPPAQEEEEEDADSDSDFGDAALVD